VSTIANDPAWTHLENISECAKVDHHGCIYFDDESRSAQARLDYIRAKHGAENVKTGNADPISPGRIGIYIRVSS
jgi:hypothetical protein